MGRDEVDSVGNTLSSATQDAYRDIGGRKRRELVFETKPKPETSKNNNCLLDAVWNLYPKGDGMTAKTLIQNFPKETFLHPVSP
ncbi:MAG: hypothetical protein A2W28_04615 [Gammaproteobacteria bacterium RBG_16_51_14]|nr:MAG: hypothetical protein A2W28_04615 [Gammaproteobacteria bacterium RBG_16_51_14]